MKRILIVDDEPGIRESLAEFLEDHDIPSTLAESAEQGLEILAGQPHDLAIVDMRLPGMDGSAMIDHACRLYPGMSFIIHTGSMDYDLPPELLECGLTEADIFRKPILDLSIFLAAVRKRLD